MRASIALLVSLGACASPESPEDRLHEHLAHPSTLCFDYSCSGGTLPIDPVVACMNDALTNGTRAMARWAYQDRKLYYVMTYVFIEDRFVKPFTSHPDEFGDYVSEDPTCSGPVRVSDGTICAPMQPVLAWGCP